MAGLDATSACPDDEQSEMRRAQIASYVRQAPVNSLASIAAASWQAYALWPVAPHAWVIAWYLVIGLIAAVMLWSWWRERGSPRREHVSPRLISRATLWAALTGALWGSSALFLGAMDVGDRTLAMIAVIGMASGAATTLAAIPACAIAFIIASMVPMCSSLLLAGQPTSMLLSGLTAAYLLALLASTRVVYGSFLASARAAARSERLMGDFARAEQDWLEISDSNEAFAMLDAEHRLLLCNAGFRRLWGLSEESLRGVAYRDVLQRSPGSPEVEQGIRPYAAWLDEQIGLLDRPDEALLHQLAGGRWLSSRVRRAKDGRLVVVHVDISALKDRESDVTRAYAQLELQNRQIEEAAHDLAVARDLALRANAAKSTFLANMSHELRTPLNAIIGFSEIIEREMFGPLGSERYREYLGDIGRSGRYLLTIINDILDMSKIEAHKMELHEEDLEIADLVGECIRVLTPRAAAGQVQVVSEITAGLPRLYADPIRLRQVVINLLSNAIKFTDPEGRVTIRAGLTYGGCGIAVEDTGRGMSGEEIEIALQPFRQVANAYAREHEGTGLGLPLAKALVALHGGTLEVTSRPGSGTTVTATLPPSRLVRPEPRRAAS
jgi:signal transduction histidine kinase